MIILDPEGRNPPPASVIEFIKDGKKFLIAGHKEPDGDCLGSQLALASFLSRIGKEVHLCSAGPFKRSEVKPYEYLFKSSINEQENVKDAKVIILDCASLDRTGNIEQFLKGLPLAVIDHHPRGDLDPSAIAVYIDPKAPSTTLMIMKIIEELGMEMNKEEAEYIFFGLSTDTGFFRHIDSNGAETFEAAAALIRAGANPREAFHAVYGGKSLNSRKLLGHALLRVESFFDGKLVVTSEEYEETSRFGQEGRDSDSLYRLLLSVSGVEAVVVIRQESSENCTIGFRSNASVDVGSIAEKLGGGGHKNAAGLSLAGTTAEIKLKIIKAFEKVF